jgi:two-component system, LytTR family, sensor kinase
MKNILRNDRLFHLLIWLLIIIPKGFGSFGFIERANISVYLTNMLFQNGILLALIYINLLVLIPKLYAKNNKVLYFIILAILITAQAVFSAYWDRHLYVDLLHYMKLEEYNLGQEMPFNFFNAIQYVVISFLLNSASEHVRQKKQMDELNMAKLNTEINYLKAQINPHFLFNTLNNLYGLSLEKSDKTPASIMMLSKMMDYMLYEASESKVSLAKDIENIENYIGLERLRQGNNAAINYRKTGDEDDQKIVPLLLLPLVENAFKHGINQQIKGAFVDIVLEIEKNKIRFSVENNFVENSDTQNHGIGLENLKKRLELHYKGNYALNTSRWQKLHRAMLEINL